jgi:hypothetical protein
VKVERTKPLESVEDIDVGRVDDEVDEVEGAGVVEEGEGEEEVIKVVTMEERVVSEVVGEATVDDGAVALWEVKDLKDGMDERRERRAHKERTWYPKREGSMGPKKKWRGLTRRSSIRRRWSERERVLWQMTEIGIGGCEEVLCRIDALSVHRSVSLLTRLVAVY